ncbi:MAG TPA: pseudouridine synthase [Candidatus Polarisedimenticolaceae bacterium]|nr:pseudouridine synthase [Candidatus Polarisedimenticolaceae bacterium]
MTERLQKVLAHAGIASRRAAERLMLAGRVTVNGTVATELGIKVDPERDAIKVDGRRVGRPPSHRTYLAFHKPRGVVTTLSDPEGRPTVRDYLRGVRARVFPVGRLDYDSEGLLLLTDDGPLARELMHPSRGVEKTYAVKVKGQPDNDAVIRLRRGVPVDGRRSGPAQVRIVRRGDNAWLQVSIVEGRNRQVRKMLQAVGHPVQRLRRIRYGGVELGTLPVGAVRALSEAEIIRLKRAARADASS